MPLAPEPPATLVPEVTAAPRPLLALPRWLALIEAVLVCGIPTQIVLFLALWFGGLSPFAGDKLSLEFFAILSLLDTAAIALLIRLFLGLSGERSNDVFIGRKPVAGEVWRGLLLVPVVFMGVMGLVLTLRWIAPWLQTVREESARGLHADAHRRPRFSSSSSSSPAACARSCSGRSSCTASSGFT